MNEQRLQAYCQLIKSLLNCTDGKEPEILAANQELLDAGFVQKVEEVAQMCSQHGDEKTANLLQSLAMQLGEGLNLDNKVDLQSLSEEEIQAYYQFLTEVIQATADSSGNSQVVYPLLTKNTDKLDGVLAEVLRRWGTNRLGEAKADEAEDLAANIVAFSNLIAQFPLGSKASNMEIAITGYEVALKVYTREALPVDWAATQNNLGAAYSDRIKGDKAENIENAIAAHTAALTVYTREALPQSWAATQYNLANAYSDRIKGDRAENIENAIAAYTAALTVRTREALPVDWAATQNNLAIAYSDRIKGDRAENIENAIAAYTAALTVRTREALPVDWAMTQNNLAIAYSDRIKGDRAENIENAIAAYTAALTVYTREALPQSWAMTQNNLAIAYSYRIKGDKADNIENAIAAYTAALTVRTREALPQSWATTQNNLAIAYSYRIKGDRAENIENAIAAYTAALTVKTREALPVDWAITQNNLGAAYSDRIKGDKAENIENAIAAYTAVLTVYTREALPVDWAMTQNNLANAYSDRIKGDRAENIENAIAAYTAALTVRTREALPVDWAMTQNNLAVAYSYRIKGDKADNIENAIAAYTAALTVRTREDLPQSWATTQNNLAIAYSDRINGNKADNIENAIAAYTAALTVRTREALPVDWATTQNNLAIAYSDRINGDKAENIENAIATYTAALTVRTREALPLDWAMTQNNLANAYSDRIKGERAENIENAIAAYIAALTVRTREALPEKHAETLFGLGRTYQDANQFDLAYNTFEFAIATIESLREEIVSGEESKRRQAERFNQLYRCIVEVCRELNKITEAIEYVERSKTRNLVEQILERDSKTIFPPEVVTQLETYRDEIATGQYKIQNGKAENPQILAQHLQELRQQRNELQNRYLPVGYGFKFDSFQPTLDERTAIIEWYILNEKILAFIVTKKGEITVWQSQPEDREALENWRIQYFQNYYNEKDQWQNSLGEELNKLASILHIDEILTQIPKHCDKLILIPHQFLHLFPLHALPVNQNSENSSCLLDLFAGGVSYAPSCQLLQQVQQRKRPDFQSLFAIQNPTEDLNYTNLEVQVIQGYFNTANVLKKTAATLTAINNSDLNTYHCAHFSCHGKFNLKNPGKSALILADAPIADTPTKPDSKRYLNVRAGENYDLDKCLTLDKIFSLKLEKCRLVTLSACETGLIDFNNASDEYIGLPSGFLLAGSQAVVSSLWEVDDFSTTFLMMKFYENLQTINTVSIALNQAQQWLRNLTTEEFEALLVKYHPQIEEMFAQIPEDTRPVARAILRRTSKRKPHPFAAPFYWAGFTATGL
ncbi:CHAT domain-containing protein [Tolypothrix sp. PCC 7910]|uniref:CHAT domain-containing protein n=1 Tax=Tolypothrix sp. PCC 7910 TaxID=2099387 RepID=UPI001427977D|nr:CHAT domain-containing protein [Tolypothrix sp. PCC 7910]QIR37021.1 CHAT domain-containing protein [Tolypothrix sp. PCC 7910]